jgi:hypothetical protein
MTTNLLSREYSAYKRTLAERALAAERQTAATSNTSMQSTTQKMAIERSPVSNTIEKGPEVVISVDTTSKSVANGAPGPHGDHRESHSQSVSTAGVDEPTRSLVYPPSSHATSAAMPANQSPERPSLGDYPQPGSHGKRPTPTVLIPSRDSQSAGYVTPTNYYTSPHSIHASRGYDAHNYETYASHPYPPTYSPQQQSTLNQTQQPIQHQQHIHPSTHAHSPHHARQAPPISTRQHAHSHPHSPHAVHSQHGHGGHYASPSQSSSGAYMQSPNASPAYAHAHYGTSQSIPMGDRGGREHYVVPDQGHPSGYVPPTYSTEQRPANTNSNTSQRTRRSTILSVNSLLAPAPDM